MRIKKSPCGAGCGVIFLRYGVGMAAGERVGAQPPPPPAGGRREACRRHALGGGAAGLRRISGAGRGGSKAGTAGSWNGEGKR